jgi:hypothetical protein
MKDQACYKSGIISPEYHEIKGVDGELWLKVELEQADIHASINPINWVIPNCDGDAWPVKNQMSRVTSLPSPAIVRPGLQLTLCWQLPAPFSFHQTQLYARSLLSYSGRCSY